MKNIKKVLSVLSAVSFMSMYSIGALAIRNERGIVTSISATANSREELFSELSDAYKHYAEVLQSSSGIHCLESETRIFERIIQRLLEQRAYLKLPANSPIRLENEQNLTRLHNIFGQDNLQNLLSTRYDDEVHTLCYYEYIINGGVGTSNVWANYFSKLLSDKKIENYILNISDDYGNSNHIVAYRGDRNWYGVTCYNSHNLINGEEISDLNTCLKNVFRLYPGNISIYVDVAKCQYFRDLDISKFTEDEMDNYMRNGIHIKIPKELLNSGDWNTIKNRLMQKITQCHDREYLRTIHPVYLMVYNLLNV